jgi:DoxX-like family
VSGGLALSHTPRFMTALAHLGYPAYFSNLLGVGKLVGVGVLLLPGLGRLKEWAYAAFGIVVLSACYSHLSSGDGAMALEPLLTGAALVISYVLRPADRRIAVESQVAVRV